MFTGLVEAKGLVRSLKRIENGLRVSVDAEDIPSFDCAVGDSIAVNGCCLTAIAESLFAQKVLAFDISSESLSLTNLNLLRERSAVNLERAMRIGDRLGGHLVTGHIDGTATVTEWMQQGLSWHLQIRLARNLAKYCVLKGSICLNGISLTINEINDYAQDSLLRFTLIPETVAKTNIAMISVGDRLNVEVDQLAKFAERLR